MEWFSLPLGMHLEAYISVDVILVSFSLGLTRSSAGVIKKKKIYYFKILFERVTEKQKIAYPPVHSYNGYNR